MSMEQKFKVRAAFTTVLVIALGVFFYQTLSFYVASGIMALVTVVAVLFIIGQHRNITQRRKWLQCPIPPILEEFDAFFWDLTIHQQDWYLTHIYSDSDTSKVVSQYEEKVKSIWTESDLPLLDKIEQAREYEDKMLSLLYFMDYPGDDSDFDDDEDVD